MARILIAGCGEVGSALARRLLVGGHGVLGIRRRPVADDLPRVSLDLLDGAALDACFRVREAFDVVVVTTAASRGDEGAYREAYVDALRSLLGALTASHRAPPVLLCCSSTSVYAQDRGEWVDEDSPTTPANFRGQVQLEAEALVDTWAGPHCVLRLGGLYGPGRPGLLRAVQEGRAVARVRYTNRIHRDDASGILARMVGLPRERLPSLLLGVDDNPVLQADVVAWIADRLGVARPEAGEGERVSGKRCRNARLHGFGYRLRYPSFREGYGALVPTETRAR